MEIKTFKEFTKIIKSGKAKGAFAILGQEKYLVKESIDMIYTLVDNLPELNIITIEGDSINEDSISNAFESMPFMCDRKIIHIKNPDFLRKTGGASKGDSKRSSGGSNGIVELLIKCVNNLADDIILVVSYDGEADDRNKLITVVKNVGYKVDYNWLKAFELQEWVIEKVSEKDKSISKTDAAYLISTVGTSMEQILGEINKICSYIGEEKDIKKENIDSIASRSLESNIFKMVDSISKRDADTAISILNTLLFQKEDYLRIMGMVIRQYRLMLLIKLHDKQNASPESIASKLRLNAFVLQNLLRICRSTQEDRLKKSLNLCLNMDYDIKRGRYTPEMGLEFLLVELCR